MATFDMNKRGGFTVDRDSLHASDGHRRQVAALEQLREQTMNADVEKAVEALKWLAAYADSRAINHIVTVRQALRDQEAEIGRLTESLATVMTDSHDEIMCLRGSADDLRAILDTTRQRALKANDRAEKTEALLRDASRYLDPRHYSEIIGRITAHLGAEQ